MIFKFRTWVLKEQKGRAWVTCPHTCNDWFPCSTSTRIDQMMQVKVRC
jgi:hypothetical protein